jgi:exonuclease SbcC
VQITKLELRNIKSYGTTTSIPFSSGVNAISGPNGAGKSTILEAIGFALFDELPYTQNQFLREGEKRGEIIVSFIDAMDEREYQVVRPIGGGTPYVYDPQVKRRLATGKRDTTDWIHEHLGLDPTAELKALFRDAVGVPQGALTAPFMETRAAVRKATFDPLLQVDDYETAWQRLRDSVSYLHDLQQDLETQMAELSGQLRRRVGLQQEEEELRAGIAADRAALAETTAQLADLQQENTRLEGLKAQIDDLAARKDGIGGRLGQLQHRQADAKASAEEARRALSIVKASEAGHHRYETAQSELAELESRRTDRDDLVGRLNTTIRDTALLAQRITDAEETLARIEQAETRSALLMPLIKQQDRIENDLQSAKRDVDRWNETRRRLDEERARLNHLEAELTELTKDLETRSHLEADVKALEVQRETTQTSLEELTGRLSKLETERTEAREELQTAERSEWELRQASDGLEEVTKHLARLKDELSTVELGLQQRRQTEAALAELDQERHNMAESLSELDKNSAAQEAKIEAILERIDLLGQTEGAVCPVCRQSLPDHQAQHLMIVYEESKRDLEKQRTALSEERAKLSQRLTEHEGEASALQAKLDELPHATRNAELVAQIEERQKRATQLRETVSAIGDAEERAIELRKHLDELSGQIETLQREREEQEGARAEIDRKITTTRMQIAELPSQRQQEQARTEIKAQEEIIRVQGERLEGLAGAQTRVSDLSAKLATLGNPRQEGLLLEIEVNKRAAVEEQLDLDSKEQVGLENNKHTIETALLAYASLDDAIADQQTLLQQHVADHQAFLRNQQAAQSLPEREERLAELEEERATLEEERSSVARKLTAVEAGYDLAHHRAVGEKLVRIQREEASLTERLHLRDARLTSVTADLDTLQQLQDELDQATVDHDALVELESTLRFLRDTIRQAGPFVTRRLVQSISLEADRIFGDVIADHAMRLSWGDDYSISVESRGEARVFQQLSGGEQMAAALAVRLALLREMSDVDIAFFDEPTANLDDERRENLAEQITGIKGFSQLFVISHDDTFEQETQHVVHIRKEHGVSRVEVR